MIAVIYAIRQEIVPMRAHMNVSEKFNKDDVLFYMGDLDGLPVTLVQSGIGRKNAVKATNLLLDTMRVNLLISSGVAGGVKRGIRVGDLVIGENVSYTGQSDFENEDLQLESSFQCKKENVQLAREFSKGIEQKTHYGDFLTVDRVISHAKTKKKIGESGPFLSVDMESAAVAEVASGRDVDFTAIRSISDDVEDNLQLDGDDMITDQGKVKVAALALKVMRRPQTLGMLMRLNEQTKIASKNLASFMSQFIPVLYDGILT